MAKLKVLYKAIDPYYSDCEQIFIGDSIFSCEEQMLQHDEWLGKEHPNGVRSIYDVEILLKEE